VVGAGARIPAGGHAHRSRTRGTLVASSVRSRRAARPEPRRQPSRGLVGFAFDGDPAVRGRCRERGVVALVLIGVRGGDGAIHVLPAAEVAGDCDRSPERAWRPGLGGRLHTDRVGRVARFRRDPELREAGDRRTAEVARRPAGCRSKKALTTGLVVILLMPSGIIMPTVATNLDQAGSSFAEALPFIGLTVLVAVLPRSRFRGVRPLVAISHLGSNVWLAGRPGEPTAWTALRSPAPPSPGRGTGRPRCV
jgi:hypothetical protein